MRLKWMIALAGAAVLGDSSHNRPVQSGKLAKQAGKNDRCRLAVYRHDLAAIRCWLRA